MAKFIYDNIKPITFQYDIQIGVILRNYIDKCYKVNINFCGLIQNKKFSSDIQHYFLTSKDLINIFDLPQDIIENVLSFLPQKLNNKISNTNINSILYNNHI